MRQLRQGVALTVVLVAVAVLTTATTGCGRGPATQADEPDSPDGTLVSGEFTAIPRPDGAVPVADPVVDGRTTTQTFRVLGSGAQEIMGFYELGLPDLGWQSMGAAEVGNGVWRERWARQGRTLEVSVGPFDDNDPVNSQLDLLLTG